MISLNTYIIEKLHLNKDIEKHSCFSQYKEGDIVLLIFHIQNLTNLPECICLNIGKIDTLDTENKKILMRGYTDKHKFQKLDDNVSPHNVIDDYEYLYEPDENEKIEILVISTNEVIKFLDEMKENKTFDFNSYIGKKSNVLTVTGDGEKEITNDEIDKYKNWFNEANK